MDTLEGPHPHHVDEFLCTTLQPFAVTASEDENIAFKWDVKVKFIRGLVSQLENRFSDSQTLTALAVFDSANMLQSFNSYGEKETDTF